MRIGKGARDLGRNLNCFLDCKLLPRHPLTQGLAFNKLCRDKVNAVGFADVIDGDDIRMIQRQHGARFLAKALHALLVVEKVLRQDLQRYFAAQGCVFCEIDFTHPTTA